MIALKTAAILALSALAFSLPALTGAETQLTRVVDGRVLSWPVIGTEAYSRSCTIEQAFEDHSAIAYCSEDGATFQFDPDGSPEIERDHNRIPSWSAGWYAVQG